MSYVQRTRTPGALTWSVPKSWLDFSNVMLFLIPATIFMQFDLVGTLFLSDFIMVFALVVLLVQGRLTLNHPFLKPIMLFFLAWLFAAIFSDVINDSLLENMLRGLAKVTLTGLYIFVFFNLIDGNRNKFIPAMLGVAIGTLLHIQFNLSGGTGGEYELTGGFFGPKWKFGHGAAVTIGLAILATAMFGRRTGALMVLLLTPLHLFLGARSLFLTTFLGAGLSYMSRPAPAGLQRLFLSSILFIILAGGLAGGQVIYDKTVRTGVFGQEVLEKHLNQTRGGGGILLGGRSESLISTRAIADNPIIGHGSWAQGREYVLMYKQMIEARGGQVIWEDDSALIPSHSVFLGSWVEHGIFGALFWGFGLFLALRALTLGVMGRRPASYIEMAIITAFFWDVLFSPFGAHLRCILAFYFAAISVLVSDNLLQDKYRKALRAE